MTPDSLPRTADPGTGTAKIEVVAHSPAAVPRDIVAGMPSDAPRKLRTVLAGALLVLGAVSFGAFWFLDVAEIDGGIPRAGALAVHGLGVVGLVAGLGLLAAEIGEPPAARTALAAATVLTALAAVGWMPALVAGFGLIARGLWLAHWPRLVVSALAAGAAGLGVALVGRVLHVGSRILGEGSEPWDAFSRTCFQASLVALTAALVGVGVSLLRMAAWQIRREAAPRS